MFLCVETRACGIPEKRKGAMDRIEEIAAILSTTKDSAAIEGFLRKILTRQEVEEISSRWEIIKLLDEGVSQRKISEQLGVSLCKITRGSRELRDDDSVLRRMVEKHKRLNSAKK
jgi:TrpR family trp operon transcriptional repressor